MGIKKNESGFDDAEKVLLVSKNEESVEIFEVFEIEETLRAATMAIVLKLLFRRQWLRQGVCVVGDDGNGNANALSKLVLFKGVCRRSVGRVRIEERSRLKNYHHGGDEFYWKGVITCGSDCPKSDVKCVLVEK